MEVLKFYENIDNEERVYRKNGKDLYKRTIDHYNSKGYKLYYYKNFELIEIPSVRRDGLLGKFKWNDNWGTIIFFLNDPEYNQAMKIINKSKELYDQHIKSANTISKIPLSSIYHDILQLK